MPLDVISQDQSRYPPQLHPFFQIWKLLAQKTQDSDDSDAKRNDSK